MGGLAPQRSFDPSGAAGRLGPPLGGDLGPYEPRLGEGMLQLERTARLLAPLGAPVIVFNASHSGSRLLATMLKRLGVFMGSNLNESEDSLDLFGLVRYIVEQHAPDFSGLFSRGDVGLPFRAQAAVGAHLADRPAGQRWGWKLPETGHVLPVMSRLFPEARCVHLVRDGRDVAFSPFLAPKAAFWRKIYFNDDRIDSWHGHAMSQRAYRAHGHVFNAARWVNSVTLGRAHGAMLGERYLEVRYEALVADPVGELGRLAEFIGVALPPHAPACADVRSQSVGKWRRQPAREIEEVRAVLEPTLAAFGYDWEDGSAGAGLASKFSQWLGNGVSAGPRTEPGGLGGLFRVRDRR
ncbi:MAG TPA: sulfotransferase [Caulobacteraceae bacterium]|nr:sulfotransferase [Caulobacteraceae bacterium]